MANKENGSAEETVATTPEVQTPATSAPVKKVKAATKTAKPLPKAAKAKTKPAAKKAPVKKPAAKKAPVKKPVVKKAPVKKPAKKTAEIRTADNSNRDFGRIRFNGEDLPKGRAVLAVVSEFVKKHPKVTLPALQEKFPDELMRGPWGLIKEVSAAKKLSGNKKLRYFLRDKDVLSIAGKKVVVCNQWSSDGFKDFAKHAKTLGYNLAAARK